MKTTNLEPVRGQMSFYGKAKVIDIDDGWKYLKSYSTIVAAIDPRGGLLRLSQARSMTTSRHVESFFERFSGARVRSKEFYSWNVSCNSAHPELEEEQ